MPLPPAHPKRTPRHVRSIRIEAFERDDGLWDLEATLTDVKPHEFHLRTGPRAAGAPVHDMTLRVTFDASFGVVDAHASSDAVPYPGHCDAVPPAYGALVGLNLLQGFRHAVRERLGGTLGCTHMSELASVLPTAAVQALAGVRIRVDDDSRRPMQLDRCRALRADGEAARLYYPRWWTGAPASSATGQIPATGPIPATDPIPHTEEQPR